MKERPILFTGEMVRAIIDGRKTQTRRPVKFGKTAGISPEFHHLDFLRTAVFTDGTCVHSPSGTVGDRLWVRETWRCRGGREYEYQKHQPSIMYRADAEPVEAICNEWRPSIHMPRWASRIDLEITAVRVERVQDITEKDAKKEGISVAGYYTLSRTPHRSVFRELWQSIYGTWEANPWVWVYEFRRVKP